MRARHSSSTSRAARGPIGGRVRGLPAWAGFAWLAGACGALWSTLQPGWGLVAVGAALALAAGALGRTVLACLLGGFVVTAAVAQARLDTRWPESLAGERVLLAGVVESLPARRGDAVEFDLRGAVLAPAARARALRVRVRWRAPPVAPRAGERWRLVLRLQPPRAPLNPGGVDAERFLFREGIDALGVVVPATLTRREAGATAGWPAWREAIAARIRETVVDRDAAALIAGLAVGATADMTREQWRVFGATGTVHLVAISGLHVTMFAWLATLAARHGWRLARLGRLCNREPLAAAVGLLAATGYALLAGFSVPTQRTLLMLAIWWGARLAGRPQGGLEVVGLALLGVLLLDPLAPLAAGFWLSFAAIGVLIATDGPGPAESRAATASHGAADRHRAAASAGDAASAGAAAGQGGGAAEVMAPRGAWHPATLIARAARALRDLTHTQWRITAALAPATLLLFGSVPLAGLLANLVAIPLFSVALVPLILASLAAWPVAPALAGAGWQLAEHLYLLSWPAFEALADLPGAVWSVQPELAWLPVGLLALPWVLLPGPRLLRATSLAALLPLLGPGRLDLAPGEFAAVLLEGGDGVALLVLTREHALLYDTADVYGSEGMRATRLVVPALRAWRRQGLDLVVQSRASGFRVAGVAALLAQVPVAEVRSGGRWVAPPRRVAGCERSTGWLWDDVEVRVFPATVGALGAGPDSEPPSCVLRVAARGGRGPALLVPAQVDAAAATLLASRAAIEVLRADVVVAPRRGSPAAVTAAFVRAVEPRHVLVASRQLDDARRRRIASEWRLPPARVSGTARDGALLVGQRQRDGAAEILRFVDLQPAWIWRVPRR
jgi:competence protein ComEC